VNPALLFLFRRSFVNMVRSWLRRLKSPRYLVPFLVGVAYYLLVFGPLGFVGRQRGSAGPAAPDGMGFVLWEWVFTALALFLAAGSWIFPVRGSPLAFLEADVALLFPAPLVRKDLVRYKLLDMQKYLVAAPVFFALMNVGRQGPVRALFILVGSWLAICVLAFHGVGAKFTRLSLAEHGRSGLRRQALPILLVLAYAAFVVVEAPPLPAFGGDADPLRAVTDWLRALGRSPAGIALYPFRILCMPALAAGFPDFLLRTAVLAGVAALLYAWILRNDVAFEEAAAAQAESLARRIEAARKGRFGAAEPGKAPRKNPWRLGSAGSPEVAFVWKSVTETLRSLSPRFVVFAVMSVVLAVLFGRDYAHGKGTMGEVVLVIAAGCLAAFAALLVFAGPSFLGVNLRQDLERVEILKALPLKGSRLVRCSLAGTVLPVAALQALLVVLAVILFPALPKAPDLTPAWRIAAAFVGVLALPCVTALSASVDAAGALLFPAWVRPGQAQGAGGMEGMGYGIVTMLAKVVVLGLGAGIPLGIGVGVGFAIFALGGPLLGPAGAMAGVLAGAVLVLAELWVLCRLLGARFDRLDPSEEGMIA